MNIHLIAPSGALQDASIAEQGIQICREQGFNLSNLACLARQSQRFSGTDAERLDDLNHLSSIDPSCVVMAVRGGYGMHRLLPDIDWDSLAQQVDRGLRIVGHSDFTAFNLALLAKTSRISFAGPMFNPDFTATVSEFTYKYFMDAMANKTIHYSVESSQMLSQELNISSNRPGLLWGGNLSILVSLLGTAYMPTVKQVSQGILFIEDINEHPYRIERMLLQLLHAGYLSTQQAILVGDISGYKLSATDNGYDLQSALDTLRRLIPCPVLTNLPFGHCRDKLTLPVGAEASLQATRSGYELIIRR